MPSLIGNNTLNPNYRQPTGNQFQNGYQMPTQNPMQVYNANQMGGHPSQVTQQAPQPQMPQMPMGGNVSRPSNFPIYLANALRKY
jgi:hypothetical protein